ncbi:hypothetical protein EC991_002602 [Linnemannia zychae]|nr:hypothetical protein EC991_002602 [Linnemannia zychae]
MTEHHSPSPAPSSPQQQQQQQAPAILERLEIIRQIALTNQLITPWEDVRKALKDELELVLESNQLTYTSPSVTNPLTTTLTAIPNTNATEEPTIREASTEEQQSTGGVEASTTTATTASTTGVEAQPHAPEQQQQEKENSQAHEAEPKAVATAEDKKPEDNASQVTDHEQAASTDIPIVKDDTPEGNEAKDTESHDESGSLATVEKQGEDENKNREKSPVHEQGWPVGSDTAKFVPISTNTLLLETPQGYHDRIKGLLDAFPSAPFTIQRVCELVSNPTEHHTNLIKYLRAVEKVLMITSSINEFSNPAYSGPSALDEKEEEAQHHGSDRTVNGNYSQSKNLDFGLISTRMPSDGSDEDEDEDEDEEFGPRASSAHNNSNISEKEAYDAVLADVDAFEAQFGTGKENQRGEEGEEGDDEDEEEAEAYLLAASEADKASGPTATTAATATAAGIVDEMDVDDDQSVEAAAVSTTMEGVESPSEEAVAEGGMEVDQA